MQNLRSMVMPAYLCYVPGSFEREQCRCMIDLGLPRSTGTAYSLSCAWEKAWQETRLRSEECSWQAVYSPRTTGRAPSRSPPFANASLLTIFSIASWTACVTYCSFPLAMCSFLSPAFTDTPCFSTDCTPCLSFLHFSPTPVSVTCHHTKLAPSALPDISLVKPIPSLYPELLPFPASWLKVPMAGNQGK